MYCIDPVTVTFLMCDFSLPNHVTWPHPIQDGFGNCDQHRKAPPSKRNETYQKGTRNKELHQIEESQESAIWLCCTTPAQIVNSDFCTIQTASTTQRDSKRKRSHTQTRRTQKERNIWHISNVRQLTIESSVSESRIVERKAEYRVKKRTLVWASTYQGREREREREREWHEVSR